MVVIDAYGREQRQLSAITIEAHVSNRQYLITLIENMCKNGKNCKVAGYLREMILR